MEISIKSFSSYNFRRYSTPWVATVKAGRYDFNSRPGYYTGNGRTGEEGDLMVIDPEEGVIYAYGQKDYRGGNTQIAFAIWDGEKFVPCDKAGRIKEEE